MRGVPGCGKTTHLLRLCSENSVICSADHHFMVNREYKFDPCDLPIAQRKCLRKYIDTLGSWSRMSAHQHLDVLGVDNTNIKVLDLAPYVSVANSFGFTPEIITVRCDPVVAHRRNVHGVPENTVMRMAHSLDREVFPPWWQGQDAIARYA